MVKPFSKSKRTPVRLRHKIEKASAAKQRKQRKYAKNNPQWKSRLKKDPGIPNLFPFKDKILAEIEEKKRLKADEAQRRRDAARAQKNKAEDGDMDVDDGVGEDAGKDDDDLIDDEMEDEDEDSDPMAALLASAQARAAEYNGEEEDGDLEEMSEEDDEDGERPVSDIPATDHRSRESSRRAFDKIFKQVLENSDVVLYVLDARDPEGTRSKEVERQVMAVESGAKRLILILNKIDLVPAPVLKAWLTHLRRSFPTIPLRASTPASNAHTFDHKELTLKSTSETLLRALKAYAASTQLKRSVTVGVIGYPNVGKSSVINALTSRLRKGPKSAPCPVGSEAGITTNLREVKVDNKLKVIDSPGIVFPSSRKAIEGDARSKDANEARLVLLNALPPKHMTDPIPAITLLLSRLSTSSPLYENILKNYGITALGPFAHGDTTTDFLVQVARKRGRLGKGGVPNLNAAAMTVITDWRDGRIQSWTEAPRLQVESSETAADDMNGIDSGPGPDRKEMVKEWAAEFKLEGLWG